MIVYWVNDRNPSLADQLTSAGTPVDLSAATATFKMRGPLDGVSNATIKVNRAVDFKDASGNWRVDWQAGDLDTAGEYLVWLETVTGGKTQTLWESTLDVRSHSASRMYIELEQLKSTLHLSGETYADLDIRRAIGAACRAFDNATGRRYYLDADAAQVRTYTPQSGRITMIDDLVTMTSVKIDRNGDGIYEETWTLGTEYVLEPSNGPADGKPYEHLHCRRWANRYFPTDVELSVQVTAKFGWPSIPDDVEAAVTILATKMLRRMREAPFGIVAISGMDQVALRSIARSDPDVAPIVAAYSRVAPFA